MPENWKTFKLGEVANLSTGFAFKSKDYRNSGELKVIRGKNITEGYLRWGDDSRYWNSSVEKLNKYVIEEGDIVVGMDGSKIGKNRAIVRSQDLPSILAQRVGRINAKSKIAEQKFLWHLINNKIFENYIDNVKTGTSIPHISLTQIGNFEIELPPLQEQQSIASILSALDDKIELNLHLNKTLEEMAMALYKHWFVDFGPFQDGVFVDSELGEIPKGWEVKTVQDFGKVITGKTPSKKFPEHFGEEIAFVTPTDFKNYGKHITSATRGISKSGIEKHKNSILPKNSVIVTSIGSDMGKVAVNKVRCLTSQQINSLITDNYLYLYHFFKSNYNLLKMLAGDGTTMPIINKTSFQNIKVILPPQNILKEFETRIQEWDEQIHLNSIENQTLTQLRDTLLPKLISGEVRVKDVEKTLSEVS